MKIFRALIPFFFLAVAAAQSGVEAPITIPLREGWMLQSSAKVSASGDTLSSPDFTPEPKDWIKADVPTTVVAAQIKNGLLPDPFFGMNLRQYPGISYPIGANFSNVAMPRGSPYGVPWWYRKEFTLPLSFDVGSNKTVWLNFRGINYCANIFLNGKQIANSKDVAGAWRTYEFDVTSAVKPGTNVLAVQVWAPTEHNLAITFVDWNPAPPDKKMGLWRDVYLTTSGPVAVRHPAVLSKVDSPANDVAHLTVTAQLKNATNHPITGTLKGRIESLEFSQPVELAAGETKDLLFTPDRYPQLILHNPRLWWPSQMGTPNLYDLTLAFEINGEPSDISRTKFGIREITSDVAKRRRTISNASSRLMARTF